MTLRRYTPLKPSRGTVIPSALRAYIHARDNGCVLRVVMPEHQCLGGIEIDHVRASGGMGMKSPTEAWNLVSLCGSAHLWKTDNGRTARPLLLDYLDRVETAT
jgi:5-methylcytosine-specific restriction endonuclease McrA